MLRAWYKPQVVLIWLGCILMSFGGLGTKSTMLASGTWVKGTSAILRNATRATALRNTANGASIKD